MKVRIVLLLTALAWLPLAAQAPTGRLLEVPIVNSR